MNLRPIAAAILAITAVFATPSIAHAHEDLVQSDPTAGSEVAAGKFDITLTYSDELIQLEGGTGAEVVVTGPLEGESAIWSTGCLVINGREVSTTVDIDQPGTYRVAWRVVSNDGHPIDGTYEFTQRALIDAIIDDVNIGNSYTKPVPAKVSLQLHAFRDSPKFEGNFNYRSAIGKLNYLGQTTRPDILYAVHQAAKYSADPRVEHGEAVVYIVKYLKATRHIGLRFKPDPSKGFQCYCDTDFAGNWNKEFASTDPSTAKSRSGWIVFTRHAPSSGHPSFSHKSHFQLLKLSI